MSSELTPAHNQPTTHRYLIHYPPHPPRESDPHYRDFEAFHRRTKKDPALYVCGHAKRTGDAYDCTTDAPLELHHTHIEFALQQGVDLQLLERDYPGVSNPDEIGAWVESAANLEWLCVFHHRGAGGKHTAAYADYEASHYVRGLLAAAPKEKP